MIIKLEITDVYKGSDVESGLIACIKNSAQTESHFIFEGMQCITREYTEYFHLEPDARYCTDGIVGNRGGQYLLAKSKRYSVVATLQFTGNQMPAAWEPN